MTTASFFCLVTYNNVIQWLEKHMLFCPSKRFFHIECPGCGFQRSVVALLKGDIKESLMLYPAAIPIILLVFYTILHLRFRFSHGPFVIKTLFAGSALIIVINYIYKIINHQIIS
jgi:hypothetical protein